MSHILLLQSKSRRTSEQDTPHSADTPLHVLSLTGSPRLGAQTPACPPAPAARGPTPATAVQMDLQASSEHAEGHAFSHAVSGSLAQRSILPSSASAQQSSRQVSLGMSSEQASAGNNTASMQTSSPLTQHAQMLPATAAPQNGHHGHQDNDDMVGTNAAMFCLERISLMYTSLPKPWLTVQADTLLLVIVQPLFDDTDYAVVDKLIAQKWQSHADVQVHPPGWQIPRQPQLNAYAQHPPQAGSQQQQQQQPTHAYYSDCDFAALTSDFDFGALDALAEQHTRSRTVQLHLPQQQLPAQQQWHQPSSHAPQQQHLHGPLQHPPPLAHHNPCLPATQQQQEHLHVHHQQLTASHQQFRSAAPHQQTSRSQQGMPSHNQQQTQSSLHQQSSHVLQPQAPSQSVQHSQAHVASVIPHDIWAQIQRAVLDYADDSLKMTHYKFFLTGKPALTCSYSPAS